MSFYSKYDAELLAPQIQPWIESQTDAYQSTLVKLHPKSVKSFAVLSQFNYKNSDRLKIYPDSCPKILITLDNNNSESLLIGARDRMGVIKLNSNSEVFLISLYSYYGTKGWKVPTSETFNQILELEDALDHVNIFENDMLKASNFEERISLVSEFYRSYLTDYDYDIGIAEYAALYLNKHFDDIKIKNLVEVMGYSRRHIENQFKKINGVSLKKYSNVYRFQKALKLLLERKYSNAEIAQRMGYYDEPHLIKEFRSYTELSPSKLINLY